MKIGIPEYNIGYVGLPLSTNRKENLDLDFISEFIDLIEGSVEYNINNGFDLTCLKTSSFDFIPDLFRCSPFPDIKVDDSYKKHRLIFFIDKDYFLGSNVDDVVDSTILGIKNLSMILDNFSKDSGIILRIGSAYGKRKETMTRFLRNLSKLDSGFISKIMVTNDDRPSLFSVKDLLSGISIDADIPIVFRTLGHYFNPGGMFYGDALKLSLSTWNKDTMPIIIHSESKSIDADGIPESRNSSDYLSYRIPTFGQSGIFLIDSPVCELSCYRYVLEYSSLNPTIINRVK